MSRHTWRELRSASVRRALEGMPLLRLPVPGRLPFLRGAPLLRVPRLRARLLRTPPLPAALLLPALLLLPGCGSDSRAGEPEGGAELAGEPVGGPGGEAEAEEGRPSGSAGRGEGAEPGTPPDTGAVVVRDDGLLVNTAHDFALRLPAGVTLADATPGGDRFTLDRNGERFLYASVERGSSLDPETIPPGTGAGWALPLSRARASCAADGSHVSFSCTGVLGRDSYEAETGRPVEVFTLRRVREDTGHEGPTRMTLEEVGPFYWVAFDGGPDGLAGLLLQGRGGLMGEEEQAVVRELLRSYRQPVEGLGPGASVDDPVAPAAFLTLDGVIPVRRKPRQGSERATAIGPMTVVRPTGEVEMEANPEGPSPPWYEVEVDGTRGWVPADEVAAFHRAGWDGRRLLFRSADVLDESVVHWFLTDREGRSLAAFRTEGGDLVRPAPSLRWYAVLKREPGQRGGTLEVYDPVHRVMVHAADPARNPRWEGARIHYERGWENQETWELEFGATAFDPPRVPDAGAPVLVLSPTSALDAPEVMIGEPVAELREGQVVETTGAAEGAPVSYGDAGYRGGLWLEVRVGGGETGWVMAESLAFLVENGENGLFRASTRPRRWFVRGEMYDWGAFPYATYELAEGERLDCYTDHRWCFVDHGGDPSGTFTLFHGPSGEQTFHAEYLGRPPYWVREETVAYHEIVGGITEEGWIPTDYEEVRGRR